jgi:hypothetical protein
MIKLRRRVYYLTRGGGGVCALHSVIYDEYWGLGEKGKREKKLGSRVHSHFIFFSSWNTTHARQNHKIRTRTHQIKPPHQRITSREDQTCD